MLERRQILDPKTLYTNETFVFATHLESVNLNIPITYCEDRNGNKCVCDGNHRACLAFIEGGSVYGDKIAEGDFDVNEEPGFHLISELQLQ